MPQDVFADVLNQTLIAQDRLSKTYGRDFLNHIDYFDDLDVNDIRFDEMATDLHIMTKTENGDYISEPMNVALSRIKATNSTAPCTNPDAHGFTEAEYAMRTFCFNYLNSDMGVHIYVNTEPNANNPKKLEAKFIDLSLKKKPPEGKNEKPGYEQNAVLAESLENIGLNKLNAAKAAGRHCDSKGWLNFKKFFSSKATKEKLQNEYDNYQALKVTVAETEAKYMAATQSKCEMYSNTDPAKIAAIEKQTFETNKREVAKYNENEKAANMQLAVKIITKCADKLANYESMHMHYVNALIANKGFNKRTMGQTKAILGNEEAEAELITYINQDRIDGKPSRLSDIIAAAKDSFAKNGAIRFDLPQPENAPEKVIENAPEMVIEDDVQTESYVHFTHILLSIVDNPRMFLRGDDGDTDVDVALVRNNAVFEKHFNKKLSGAEALVVLESPDFIKEMYADENLEIMKLAYKKIKDDMSPDELDDDDLSPDELDNDDVSLDELDNDDMSPDELDKHVREKLNEATREFHMAKETAKASFVAEQVMDLLAINGNDKIPLEEKDKARKAISSHESIKSFVTGKTIEDIKSMQKDPKQQQAYQTVINTVLNSFAPKNIKKEPANIATKNIAPKNIDNKDIAPQKEQQNIMG